MNRFVRSTFLMLAGGVLATLPAGAATRMTTNAAEPVPWSNGVSYSYDSSGNITRIGSDTFAYDHVERLVQATINGVERDYEYDAFGNRTKCRQPGGDCQYGVTIRKNDNRMSDIGYDASGNVKTFAGHTYSYDDFDMVVRDDAGGGAAKEFIYTAGDERLVTYSVGSSWHWTVRDVAGRVLRELTSGNGSDGDGTASWTWTRDYVWRDGILLASRHPVSGTGSLATVGTDHYHLDHLGTPRRITDQSDRTVGFHDYYAFGPEVPGGLNEPAATSLRYTGHERDTALAESLDTLDYMHARYYTPAVGRFLSVDPVIPVSSIRLPQRWNRYSYVLNNPMGFADPSGRDIVLTGCVRNRDSDACHEQLDAAKRAFGRAWKYVNYKDGVITLQKRVSPAALGRMFGPSAHTLGYMANSRDHFNVVANATMAAKGNGAFTDPIAGGGANIYYDPAKLGGSKTVLMGTIKIDLAETFVHESGHAVEPYFASIQAINAKYSTVSNTAHEAFPMFLENAWRRMELGKADNDIRVYILTPGDVYPEGTQIEDQWK